MLAGKKSLSAMRDPTGWSNSDGASADQQGPIGATLPRFTAEQWRANYVQAPDASTLAAKFPSLIPKAEAVAQWSARSTPADGDDDEAPGSAAPPAAAAAAGAMPTPEALTMVSPPLAGAS